MNQVRISSRPCSGAKPCLIATALAALLAAPAPGASAREEYELKAAFLLNFAKFVEWPVGAYASAGAPLTLCSYGEDPFEGRLLAVARGKTVNGRPLEVRQITAPEEAAACQVVFVPDPQTRRLREIAEGARKHPVLIVGESSNFAERGGMINFVVEAEHVRFQINPSAASACGLRISSKLLQLAIIVGGR